MNPLFNIKKKTIVNVKLAVQRNQYNNLMKRFAEKHENSLHRQQPLRAIRLTLRVLKFYLQSIEKQ